MGVIKKLQSRAKIISFSEESVNSLGISQPSTPPPEPQSVDPQPPTFVPERRDPELLIQRLEQQQHRRGRRLGARKTRRADNARALQTLVEDEHEDTAMAMDIRPQSEGVFTQLLGDCHKMRVWQYFIALNEEQQEKYLNFICEKKDKRSKKSGITFTQREKEAELEVHDNVMFNEDGTVEIPNDCRYVHPAYTMEQRFWKVSPQLRKMLKKERFPLGMLEALEEEIVDVFTLDPTAVYLTQELNSFERLLTHALCQYNILDSKSASIANIRRTKVENNAQCFHAPEVSLTQYIETYCRNKQ